MSTSRVALIRGEDRYENVQGALAQIVADVDLSGKEHVLIKPNFVVSRKPLATTHPEAVRAALEFVRAHYEGVTSNRRRAPVYWEVTCWACWSSSCRRPSTCCTTFVLDQSHRL